MSISKPPLSNIWAHSAASGDTGIADPGGLKDTGWTGASACPPFSWMNWILNKCDAAARYLVARGIPDYDASESYSVGDRIQWGGSTGMTFVCIVASVGDGSGSNNPANAPTKWAPWARGIPTYNALHNYQPGDTVFAPSDGYSYLCLLANGVGNLHEPHASPTYWQSWGHTDAAVIALVRANPNILTTYDSSLISVTSGTVSSVVSLTYETNDGGLESIRDLSFLINGAANGYVDITLTSTMAFHTAIENVQFTTAVGAGGNQFHALTTGANSVRIYCGRSDGPSWSGYVRLLGY